MPAIAGRVRRARPGLGRGPGGDPGAGSRRPRGAAAPRHGLLADPRRRRGRGRRDGPGGRPARGAGGPRGASRVGPGPGRRRRPAGELTVRLRPPSPLDELARRLEVSSSAWVARSARRMSAAVQDSRPRRSRSRRRRPARLAPSHRARGRQWRPGGRGSSGSRARQGRARACSSAELGAERRRGPTTLASASARELELALGRRGLGTAGGEGTALLAGASGPRGGARGAAAPRSTRSVPTSRSSTFRHAFGVSPWTRRRWRSAPA